MALKKIELDIDFIGDQNGLTKEEEISLKDFFKKRKLTSQKRQSKIRPKTSKQSKTTA